MRGLKKTLTAGFLACAAFNAQAEMEELSYGVKAFVNTSSIRVNDEAKFAGEAPDHKLIWLGGGTLYAEYALVDYIGIELGLGYMKQGGSILRKKQETMGDDATSTPSRTIATHGLFVPLSVCVYPFGRGDDSEGIFRLFLGGSAYVPLGNPIFKADDKIISTKGKEKEFPGFDFGAQGGLGYEFPFGFLIEGKYGINFANRFKKDKKEEDQTIFDGVQQLKSAKTNYFTVGVGYNLASLSSK